MVSEINKIDKYKFLYLFIQVLENLKINNIIDVTSAKIKKFLN